MSTDEKFERAQQLEADVRREVLSGLADGDPEGAHGAAAPPYASSFP